MPESSTDSFNKFFFPLDTIEDITNFNKEIANNEKYAEYLVSLVFLSND